MTVWRPADPHQAAAAVTRLGGQPSWANQPRWPVWEEAPLPFLGQFRVEDKLILTFISFEEDALSWEPENGGNAAIVEPNGEFPPWVQPAPLPAGPTILETDVLVPVGQIDVGGQPDWIQQDETPQAATEFVCELRSVPDLDGWLMIGDIGSAYLFVSADRRRARLLWQA